MNLAKHIRKPMPAPSSAHKGVKDAPRSKAVDLSEWCFDDLAPKVSPEDAHLAWDDLPHLGITEGRSWVA